MTNQTSNLTEQQNNMALITNSTNTNNNLNNNLSSTTKDALDVAWNKLLSELAHDGSVFLQNAGQDLAEGIKEITEVVLNDSKAFLEVVEKDVKVQLNNLVTAITHEAKTDIQPKVQALAKELEKDLQITGQKIIADVWKDAEPLKTQISASFSKNTINNKINFSAALKEIVASESFKTLSKHIENNLTAGYKEIIQDAQYSWTNSLKQEAIDLKNLFIGFGNNFLSYIKPKLNDFASTVKTNVLLELNEIKNDLIETSKKSLGDVTKTLISNAKNLIKPVFNFITSKIFSKKR